jgi:NAD(P)-dependent dehydrogenase (short-subunit alcohol dehydrogenase family)
VTWWSCDDIPPLEGKVAAVTGANSGLGLEVAQRLADRGARVLLACRNTDKATVAAGRIGPLAEVVALDLASLASVERAAAELARRTDRLDILVNNAGVMAVDMSATEDGFETQIGVNHLGHFALTGRLAGLLATTPGSRVVNVSSMAHRNGALRLDDLMWRNRRYSRWGAYSQSKLANLLFTFEADRRFAAAGIPTRVLAAHPGFSRTDLGVEGTGISNAVLRNVNWIPGMGQSTARGALPLLRAAVDPDASGGQYYGPRWMIAGPPVLETPSRRARDASSAEALWDASEKLTGVTYPS